MKTKYCLGFLFSTNHTFTTGVATEVVLIAKNRPEWQAGKMNGVGGKVEVGELPSFAMRREFEEETGVVVNDWTPFAEMIFAECDVICYASQDPDKPFEVHSMTDEKVGVYTTEYLTSWSASDGAIPNLRWLIPMALSRLSDPKQGILRIEHL